MKSLFPTLAVIAWATLSSLNGQTQLRGPAASLVYDPPTSSLRPFYGLPGASYLGPPVTGAVELASLSPNGRLALYRAEGAWRLLRGLGTESTEEFVLTDVMEDAAGALWASDSSAAVLSSSNGRLQRLSGLAGELRLEVPIDLSALGESVTVLAAGKDASRIALSAVGPDGATLYLVQGSDAPLSLAAMTQPAAAVFIADTLYVADKAANRIMEFRGSEGLLLAGESDGVLSPVALAASGDGKHLYCALESRRIVQAYDLAARVLTSETAVEITPERLRPLAGHAGFVLADRSRADDPLWILDVSAAPTNYFVPAGQ